jgi:hypothetical protein
MALEYELIVAGETPVAEVARRALLDQGGRPTGTTPLLSIDLRERYGFTAVVLSDPDGYVEAASDGRRWEWEVGACVSLTFEMDKETGPEPDVINMLTAVRRVLTTGNEDAVLVFNDDVLVLARFGGEVVKHHQNSWWSFYAAAGQVFPG